MLIIRSWNSRSPRVIPVVVIFSLQVYAQKLKSLSYKLQWQKNEHGAGGSCYSRARHRLVEFKMNGDMADPTFEPYGGVAPRWAGPRGDACAKNLENFLPENTNLSL